MKPIWPFLALKYKGLSYSEGNLPKEYFPTSSWHPEGSGWRETSHIGKRPVHCLVCWGQGLMLPLVIHWPWPLQQPGCGGFQGGTQVQRKWSCWGGHHLQPEGSPQQERAGQEEQVGAVAPKPGARSPLGSCGSAWSISADGPRARSPWSPVCCQLPAAGSAGRAWGLARPGPGGARWT